VLLGAQALQRGAATGQGRFPAITAQLVTDGVLRAALSAAVILSGQESMAALAAGTCVASAAGLVTGGRLIPRWLARPRLRDRTIPTRPLGHLFVGAVGPLLAGNASLPWLAATNSQDPVTLGAFAGALTLSRLPTQFVSAAFAPLLAQLTRSSELGDAAGFRHLYRVALACAGLFGLVFVAAFAGIGPWLLSVYIGPQYELPVAALAALAAGSGALFLAYVEQAATAARGHWPVIAWSWSSAIVVFVVVLALPGDELALACAAPLASSAVAFVIMFAASAAGGRDTRR
jgi:O-antigen/teichoic acid export membrane protein